MLRTIVNGTKKVIGRRYYHSFRPVVSKFNIESSTQEDFENEVTEHWKQIKTLYDSGIIPNDESCFNLHVANECTFSNFNSPVPAAWVEAAEKLSTDYAKSFSSNNLFSLGTIPYFDPNTRVNGKLAGYNKLLLFEGGSGFTHGVYKLKKSPIDDWPDIYSVLEGIENLPTQKRILEFSKENSGNKLVYVPQICLENSLGIGLKNYPNVLPLPDSASPVVSVSAWGSDVQSHGRPQILIISDGFDQETSPATVDSQAHIIPGQMAVMKYPGNSGPLLDHINKIADLANIHFSPKFRSLVSTDEFTNNLLNLFRASDQKVTVISLSGGKKVIIGPKLPVPRNPL